VSDPDFRGDGTYFGPAPTLNASLPLPADRETGETVIINVGNLTPTVTEGSLRKAFSPYGSVKAVYIMDRHEWDRVCTFAFVCMPDDEDGFRAVRALDGQHREGQRFQFFKTPPISFPEGWKFRSREKLRPPLSAPMPGGYDSPMRIPPPGVMEITRGGP
jgi:hypothetical protein